MMAKVAVLMKNKSAVIDSRSNSDIWVALGVVFCLGLGASTTYWLMRSQPMDEARSLTVIPFKGQPINGGVSKGGLVPAVEQPAALPAADASKATPDYLSVAFDVLGSYYYEIPNSDEVLKSETRRDQIPVPIKAFDGKKVAVQGFMVPLKMEHGATKSFLIVKDQSLCCFGRMPRMNEWISVKMAGKRTTKFIPDQPVTVFGVLSVGEEIEKGEVLSVYRLEAEDVAGPMDL